MKRVSPHEAAATHFERAIEDVYSIDRRKGVCSVRVGEDLCMLECDHEGRHQ